jgi:hypothetical protein
LAGKDLAAPKFIFCIPDDPELSSANGAQFNQGGVMLRYVITAAIALTLGVLMGLGIATTSESRRLTEAESRVDELTFELKEAQDLLAGARHWSEMHEARARKAHQELREARVRLAKLDPPTPEEEAEVSVHLTQIAHEGGNSISSAEWEQMKKDSLALPAKHWSSTKTDKVDQDVEFVKWAYDEPYFCMDVVQPVRDWLASNQGDLNVVIANKPTGAQYRVTAKRLPSGAECSVKFVGNLNWK